MNEIYSRTEMLIGEENLRKLAGCRVAVFGVGGVGGYVVEALARSGIGTLDIIDDDAVIPSNINRQIIATQDTIGRNKVEVMAERIRAINPDIKVNTYRMFYLPENSAEIDLTVYDYIADAIDTVSAKLDLAQKATEKGIPIISAMGCGNRLDPSKLQVTDIFKTSNDPLAKVMRSQLRKRGVKHLKVVCSSELPIKPETQSDERKRSIPASMIFVPAAAGLLMASQIIRDLITNEN